MIISGGQNVYPAEIENVLSEHTGLLEATIIGVPDQRWGEAVCAIVVPKPGVTLDAQDVVEFVQARLASYKSRVTSCSRTCCPATPSARC